MVEFMAKIDDSVKSGYQLQEQKEDLIDRLDRILEWIKTCDTKTSILLAGMGIVGTILTSEKFLQKETDMWEVFSRNIGWLKFICILLFIMSVELIIVSIFFFILELNPFLFSKKIGNTKIDSLYFFGTISKKSSRTFKKQYFEQTLTNDVDDLLNQVYMNAKICDFKYKRTKRGIICSTIGGIGLGIVFFVGCLISK